MFWSEPGRAAEAEVDAPGMHGLERAELLGDHERRVVREHDPAGPEADVAVCAATWAMSTLVAEDAIVAMLWCSAYQIRR